MDLASHLSIDAREYLTKALSRTPQTIERYLPIVKIPLFVDYIIPTDFEMTHVFLRKIKSKPRSIDSILLPRLPKTRHELWAIDVSIYKDLTHPISVPNK